MDIKNIKWKSLGKWLLASPIILPLAAVCLVAMSLYKSLWYISNAAHKMAYKVENHKVGEYVFNILETINKWVTK